MDGVNLFICYFFLKLQDFIPHALNQYKTYETVFFSKVTGNGESSSHSWWSMLIWFTRFVMVNLYHTSESLSLLLFKKKIICRGIEKRQGASRCCCWNWSHCWSRSFTRLLLSPFQFTMFLYWGASEKVSHIYLLHYFYFSLLGCRV